MVVIALALSIIVLAADGVFVAIRLRSALNDVTENLQSGIVELKEQRVDTAQQDFNSALERLDSATGMLSHPAFWLGSRLPGLKADSEVVESLLEVLDLTARAGIIGVNEARRLGLGGVGLATKIYEDGRVRFDRIDTAEDAFAQIELLVEQASDLIRGLPSPRFQAVDDTLASVRDRLRDARAGVNRVQTMVTVLSELLGRERDRNYLLLLESPSEARGGGGFAGFHGILSAGSGSASLGAIGSYRDLESERRKAVKAPGWYQKRYGDLGETWRLQWQRANFSPHFPAAASVFLQLERGASAQRLDGVIAIDSVALASLIGSTGAIRVAEPVGMVTPKNAQRLLTRDVYLLFDDQASQDLALGALVGAFWRRVHDGKVDGSRFTAALARAIKARRLSIYARDEQLQSDLSQLGVAGKLPSSDVVQAVWHNNTGMNKVDYFLQRRIRMDIDLSNDGDARVSVTVEMFNRAPSSPPSFLLGFPFTGTPPGANRMQFNLLMPHGSTLDSFTVDQETVSRSRGREAGLPVVWTDLIIPPGGSTRVDAGYLVPGALEAKEDSLSLDLLLVPQPLVNPAILDLAMSAPPGMIFERTNRPELQLSGRFEAPRELHLDLVHR